MNKTNKKNIIEKSKIKKKISCVSETIDKKETSIE